MKLILFSIYLVIVAVVFFVFFVCGYKCGVQNLTHVIDKKIAELLKEQENDRRNENKDNADGRVEG